MRATVVCLSLTLSPLFSQAVFVRDGNIFFKNSTGRDLQITAERLDAEPSLSFDNKRVVFVRRTPNYVIGTGRDETDANEIWVAATDGVTSPKRVLAGHPGAFEPGANMILAGFGRPQFSPGGQRIYFTADTWATSEAIHMLDLATGGTPFLYKVLDVEVIRSGGYKGY